jgi:hypothetical protein
MLPPTLSTALKEWSSLCDALSTGRQILLLRKGGIYESAGEFELEHPRFLLFPTYLHQKPEMVKPADRGTLQPRITEPDQITLSVAAEVTDIIQLRTRAQMDAIDDQHIWLPPLIDMRFNYRPENPLYLILVRAYQLSTPTTIDNTPAYSGCKSWVPLGREIPTHAVTPVLSEADYYRQKAGILARIAK